MLFDLINYPEYTCLTDSPMGPPLSPMIRIAASEAAFLAWSRACWTATPSPSLSPATFPLCSPTAEPIFSASSATRSNRFFTFRAAVSARALAVLTAAAMAASVSILSPAFLPDTSPREILNIDLSYLSFHFIVLKLSIAMVILTRTKYFFSFVVNLYLLLSQPWCQVPQSLPSTPQPSPR